MHKRTIRMLPENSRDLARLYNDLNSCCIRLKHLIVKVSSDEKRINTFTKAIEEQKVLWSKEAINGKDNSLML